jgi:lipoprotein-anchoring transpeptidase ErfK/SrfK
MRPVLILLACLWAVPVALAQPCDGDCPAENDPATTYPEPAVEQLTPNEALLYDRDYYRVVDGVALTFHDAPGGAVVETWKAGDNYVTVYEVQGEWGRTGTDRWIRMANVNKQSVVVSRFTGLLLDPETAQPYPIAWSIVNQYGSPEPGANPSESRPLFYRYTYHYIYETVVDDEGYNWYRIAPDTWVHQFRVSVHQPIARPAEIDTERWVAIDLYEQVLTAYEGDRPVFTTLISSGLPWWATNEGLFNVTWMRPRDDMTQDLPNDFYYLEEIPWTSFFDRGIAMHGTYWHDGFGYPQSHGCVNMSITDAHWLYQFIRDEFDHDEPENGGAAVYVYSTNPARATG